MYYVPPQSSWYLIHLLHAYKYLYVGKRAYHLPRILASMFRYFQIPLTCCNMPPFSYIAYMSKPQKPYNAIKAYVNINHFKTMFKEVRHIEMPQAVPQKSICHLKKLAMILKWNKQNTVRLPQKYHFLLIKHKINCLLTTN